MTTDEERSAHLLFSEEHARGDVDMESVLGAPEVREAVQAPGLPSLLPRTNHRIQLRRGTATFRGPSSPCCTPAGRCRANRPPARRASSFASTSSRTSGRGTSPSSTEPPGSSLRAILRDAGVPYLLAVLLRVPRKPMEPDTASRTQDPSEVAALECLAHDPDMAFGVHGLDHRTRSTASRRHSGFAGLDPGALGRLLDAADAEMAGRGLPANTLVPPFNRFDARQYEVFARRYAIVAGGSETVRSLGFHRTPVVRSGAVCVPAYAPLYGRAGEVLPAVEELIALQPGMWIPVVLHRDRERDNGWSELLGAARAGAVQVEALRAGGRT